MSCDQHTLLFGVVEALVREERGPVDNGGSIADRHMAVQPFNPLSLASSRGWGGMCAPLALHHWHGASNCPGHYQRTY